MCPQRVEGALPQDVAHEFLQDSVHVLPPGMAHVCPLHVDGALPQDVVHEFLLVSVCPLLPARANFQIPALGYLLPLVGVFLLWGSLAQDAESHFGL